MKCPYCNVTNTYQCKALTELGYKQYRCRNCDKQFNERTGTALNYITQRTEVVMMAVRYYYRFKLSLDDIVEMLAERGFSVCHQTIHNWVQTFGIELGCKVQYQRKGQGGKKWHVDATYIKVEGRWCYLYRAIDKQGNLLDVYLSDVRDQAAAERFFKQALKTSAVVPTQITTDKEPALYPAIVNVFGECTKHRDSKYMNNRIEQNHRGIKSRYKVMKGFKDYFCALVFCTAFEEIRQYFRLASQTRAQRRRQIASKHIGLDKLVTQTA